MLHLTMAQLIYRVPLFSIFWRKKSQYKTQTVILSFNLYYQYSHTTYEGNYMNTSHLLLVVAKQQAINLPSSCLHHQIPITSTLLLHPIIQFMECSMVRQRILGLIHVPVSQTTSTHSCDEKVLMLIVNKNIYNTINYQVGKKLTFIKLFILRLA